MSHVWRIAGTLNWPNAKKVREGRLEQPVFVRYAEKWNGKYIDPEQLANALSLVDTRQSVPPIPVVGEMPLEEESETAFQQLPEALKKLVEFGVPEGLRSEEFYRAVAEMKQHGFPPELVLGILESHPGGIAEKYHSQSRLPEETFRSYGKIETDFHPFALELDPSHPYETAKKFVTINYTLDEESTLIHFQGDFYKFGGTHYTELSWDQLKSEIYAFLDSANTRNKDGISKFKATQQKVSGVMDALQALVHLERKTEPPLWRRYNETNASGKLLACHNGLLDIGTREIIEHTPNYINFNVLEIDFDPAAPKPEQFLAFLDSQWKDDSESIEAFLEIIGYMVAGDTWLQKIFLIIGPPRSGKGTIQGILASLLGRANVASPHLSSLAGNFGIQGLIGKKAAIIADARLSSNVDQKGLSEKLLTLSANDIIDVDRKHRDFWTGRLGITMMMMTNELPKISDASGALPKRFFPLIMTESFYGKEDPDLTAKIEIELPGILNLALEAYDSLIKRKRLEQPKSSVESMRDIETLAAPERAFLEETCEFGDGDEYFVNFDGLYEAYKLWRSTNGHQPSIPKTTFGRNLKSAFPQLIKRQRMIGDKRLYVIEGIRPNKEFADLF